MVSKLLFQILGLCDFEVYKLYNYILAIAT